MISDFIPVDGPCICGGENIDIAEDGDGSLYVCCACSRYYDYYPGDHLRLTLHPRRVTGKTPGWWAWIREKIAGLLE